MTHAVPPLALPTPRRSRGTRRLAAFGAAVGLLLTVAACTGGPEEGAGKADAVTTGLHQFNSGDSVRSYYLDLPEGYDPDGAPLPLVVALHGTGGSHEKWLDDTYNLAAAVGEDAVMVYPEALASSAGTNQWVIERDLPYFENLLERLERSVTYDRNRVLVTGQSSGAGMSHEIGCRYGDRVRAIAPAAGVLTATQCTGSVAVIQVQGSADPVVPYALAQQTSDFWSRHNGLTGAPTLPGNHDTCQQYAGPDDTPAAHPVHLCTHAEGAGVGREGHAWPSIAGAAIWQTFTALPEVTESADAPPGGGNAAAMAETDTTATFTVRFPDTIPSTPTRGAVVVYGDGAVTPTTAPLAFMNIQFGPGDVTPGQEVTYTVPVTYAEFGQGGFSMPGTFTVMVTMHTEDGGYPIPVPGMDLWAVGQHSFTSTKTPVVLDGVFELEPISADTGL